MKQTLSIGALWSLLWRATVWFPLALARLCVGIAIAYVFLLLIALAVVYSIGEEWWKAGGCFLGVVAFIWIGRRVKGQVEARLERENLSGRGGVLL